MDDFPLPRCNVFDFVNQLDLTAVMRRGPRKLARPSLGNRRGTVEGVERGEKGREGGEKCK